VCGSPFTVYAGLQLAEQYLVRWCADMPRSLPALAADPTGGAAWAGGSSLLAVARLGTWRHDPEALAAQAMRAWKLFVGRQLLERIVAGAIPPGSPRAITRKGVPLGGPPPPPGTSSSSSSLRQDSRTQQHAASSYRRPPLAAAAATATRRSRAAGSAALH
jgi:hypothetical protein